MFDFDPRNDIDDDDIEDVVTSLGSLKEWLEHPSNITSRLAAHYADASTRPDEYEALNTLALGAVEYLLDTDDPRLDDALELACHVANASPATRYASKERRQMELSFSDQATAFIEYIRMVAKDERVLAQKNDIRLIENSVAVWPCVSCRL